MGLRAHRQSLVSSPPPPDEASVMISFILQKGKTGISPKSLPAVRDGRGLPPVYVTCDGPARLLPMTRKTLLPPDCALDSGQGGEKQNLFVLPPASSEMKKG